MSGPDTVVLFLGANPKDTERLAIDDEARAIEAAIDQAEYRDLFSLEKEFAVRVTDLQRLVLKHRPQIVHFAGHGAESSEVILEDAEGNAAAVPSQAFSRLFALLRPPVVCVVLNACFSEDQAAGIAQSVDCVIGMANAVGDEAAAAFAVAFYQALAFGESIQTAFDLACLQVDLEKLGDSGAPRLITRNGAAERTLAHAGDPGGEAGALPAGTGSPQAAVFTTQVTDGHVGQVISIDKLEGDLTIGTN